MGARHNMDRILTTDGIYWNNAHTSPPDIGSSVEVLNQDGCRAGRTTWTADSIKYFDGWLPSPRIPPDIRAIQLARYTDRQWPAGEDKCEQQQGEQP